MGNYSKDPETAFREALKKGYARVRFQQGKPILDRELNLLGDLAGPERLAPYIGNGVPAAEKGLEAHPPADPNVVEFYLLPGTCIVNGLAVTLADKISYREQTHNGKVEGSWPYTPGGIKGTVSMGYVYLRVFLTEVNDTADTALRNQEDIGFETTLRQKADWELLLLPAPNTQPDHFLLAEYEVNAGGIGGPFVTAWRDRRVLGLTLAQVRKELDAFRAEAYAKTTLLASNGSLLPNSVTNSSLQDNSVSITKIQDLAVTTVKLANLSVSNAKLQDLSVGNTKLQDLSVSTLKLAEQSVTNSKLQDLSVDTTKLANNSVNSLKLVDNAVGTTKIQDGSVTNLKLAANAVDGGRLAANSVGIAHLQDNSVTNAKLATGAVSNNELGDLSVGNTKLQNLSVGTTKLQDASVTLAKMGTGAVGVAQLKFTLISSGSLTLSASGSITFILLNKIYMGADNFIVYSLWGDGDFTWSEYVLNGNRYLKVQNTSAVAFTINYMMRRLLEP